MRSWSKVGLALCLCLPLSAYAAAMPAAASDSRGLEARNERARHFFSPAAHLRLARYHYDSGNKIQAFYISEHARDMFGDDRFDAAFQSEGGASLNALPRFKDEAEYYAYCKEHPESAEAHVESVRRMALESPDDHEAIRNSVDALLAAFPDNFRSIALAAPVYFKILKDEERALPLYIDLYFFNPHYYDGEYAEFRVKHITSGRKQSWRADRKKVPLLELARTEKNPRVLDVVVDEMAGKWESAMVAPALSMFENDDTYVQSAALKLLLDHTRDLSGETQALPMLESSDLVRRAMAAFLVVQIYGAGKFPLIKKNLDSGVELVQVDAMLALATCGGKPGIEYLRSYRPVNFSEDVKHVLEDILSDKPTGFLGPGGSSED